MRTLSDEVSTLSEEVPAPYLSVVVTSRNDNHGGTLTRRMQTFVNALVAQCRRHNVPTELIFVEWNPPADKPKLIEALRWPKEMSPCQVRIIEVPPEIHARYRHAQSLPLYQFIAKNVGIRRARGEFVLATNIDVLFNHDLMSFIAQRKLEKGKMYRIDRHDVDTFVPEDAPIDEMLAYCDSHLLRVNAREGSYPTTPTGLRIPEPLDILSRDSGIALGAGWFEAAVPPGNTRDKIFRFLAQISDLRIDPGAIRRAGASPHLLLDIQPALGLGNRPFTLIAHAELDGATREIGRIVVMARETVSIPLPPDVAEPLHLRLQVIGDRIEVPGDPRDLQAWVYQVELRGQHPQSADYRDVFPVAQGLAAGKGWGDVEQHGGGYIRWLLEDAEVWYSGPPGRRYVIMELQPGPGVGRRPFALEALDESGKEFFSTMIMQRQKVAIPLQYEGVQLKHFILRAQGTAVDGDPRLKVLLHRVELSEAPSTEVQTALDVFPAGIPVAAGSGWYCPETRGGAQPEKVRWLSNDGEVWYVLDDADTRRFVVLELEPGPGVYSRPCRLRAMDGHGAEIFSAVLMGRQRIAIPVQTTAGRLRKFVLHIDGTGVRSDDGRILTALLTHVDLVTDPPPDSAVSAHDVFPLVDGIAAGKGWYPVEQSQGRYVRWLDSEGEVWFAAPVGQKKPVTRYAVMHFDLGPAVDRRPFILRATSADGQEFFSAAVMSRRPVVIPIEFTPGELSHFTLRIPATRPDAHGRVLGALLTKMQVLDQPPAHEDCVPESVALGTGWYGVEKERNKPVRWMTSSSELLINVAQMSTPAKEIQFDLQVGASVGRKLNLTIRDDTSATLFRDTLSRRQTITVPLPQDRREIRLFLEPSAKGKPVKDGRVLLLLARDISLIGGTPATPGIARPGKASSSAPAAPLQIPGSSASTDATTEPMVPAAHADIVSPVYLHNNACGDFTLMHRDHWFETRGHAEWDAFSIHLDSLLCYCAHHSGAIETMLTEPMRCYHIEHSVGSGWTPEGMNRLLRRIRVAGIRDVDWREVGQIAVILRRYNSPVSFSPSDWGLINDTLPETVVK
jgi:hypothetical protein